ncbi:alpha-beta hydrolase family esterase [Cavenderia fasciculata]|uniref:Alpha-beta hydrolase family esterase n=1 Tax=Cavenderia fasciculata TaxID=261658 RepID=F4Q4D3_CACFS|nr:alpha-beta hydrolase family esterase [Cavenderia fasciculata]EGG16995.1 alpha-beta hydrolase family esterase [Cavenderia fasciculata]|eukprot:XP_004355479.1 alpha-beta hydrolase family esterase [Cavenderia fasciculata]
MAKTRTIIPVSNYHLTSSSVTTSPPLSPTSSSSSLIGGGGGGSPLSKIFVNSNQTTTTKKNTTGGSSNRASTLSAFIYILSIPKHIINYLAYILFFIPSLIYNLLYNIIQWISNTKAIAKQNSLKNDRKKELVILMKNTGCYKEWLEKASELDLLEEKEKWRTDDESAFYDYKLIRFRLNSLRVLAQRGDYVSLSIALREGLLRNLGGMGNAALFQESHVGTKYVIEEYVQEVVKQLNYIAYNVPKDRVSLDFFYETRQSFGRSALLLSGGATLDGKTLEKGCHHGHQETAAVRAIQYRRPHIQRGVRQDQPRAQHHRVVNQLV